MLSIIRRLPWKFFFGAVGSVVIVSGWIFAIGAYDQCYNAQLVVATGSMLIVAADVTQAANDKGQLLPMVEKLQALPEELGRAKRILADNGYFSQGNVEEAAPSL